jgi:hypothetical protein
MNQAELRRRLRDAVADVHASDQLWQRIAAGAGRRRRQQRRALAVYLAVVVGLAAAVAPVVLDRLAADHPAATTTARPAPPSTVILGEFEAAEPGGRKVQPIGPIYLIAEGTARDPERVYSKRPSWQWKYIAFQSTTGSICSGFYIVRVGDEPPPRFGCSGSPGRMDRRTIPGVLDYGIRFSEAALDPAFPAQIAAMLGPDAVEVRLTRRNGEQIVIKPVGGFPDLPPKFFALVISDEDGSGDVGMLLENRITIVDRNGEAHTEEFRASA